MTIREFETFMGVLVGLVASYIYMGVVFFQ